jgi:hypothetical protein
VLVGGFALWLIYGIRIANQSWLAYWFGVVIGGRSSASVFFFCCLMR